MTRKSRIRSKRSVSRKIRGSRRRVQRGGEPTGPTGTTDPTGPGGWFSDLWKNLKTRLGGKDHPYTLDNSGAAAESTIGQNIDDYTKSTEAAVSGAASEVKNTLSNWFTPSPVTPSQVPVSPVTPPVTQSPVTPPVTPSGQNGGKRRRRPQTHIRLNRKYISRKMNNIVDIFRKQLTCKNKGKNKKSRRHYRGGAHGNYPGAVGNINVPMPSRP